MSKEGGSAEPSSGESFSPWMIAPRKGRRNSNPSSMTNPAVTHDSRKDIGMGSRFDILSELEKEISNPNVGPKYTIVKGNSHKTYGNGSCTKASNVQPNTNKVRMGHA